MEENCLAAEAYRMRRENPNFTLETRRLLRFTTSIENIGDADFRPFIPKSAWQWHACHMHYHSMEVRNILGLFAYKYVSTITFVSFKYIYMRKVLSLHVAYSYIYVSVYLRVEP